MNISDMKIHKKSYQHTNPHPIPCYHHHGKTKIGSPQCFFNCWRISFWLICKTFNLSQNIGGHCIFDESECFYSSIYKCVLNHQTLYSNIHFFPLIENWNITISFLTCCLLNKNLPSQLWGPVARPINNNNK